MVDILVKQIPLPVPHPSKAVRFEVTDLPDIYSHTTTLKEKTLELLAGTNIYEFAEKMEDIYFSVIAIAAIGAILGLGYLIVAWVVRKICGND